MLGIEWVFKWYLMTVTKQMQIHIIWCFFIVFHKSEFSNVSPRVLVTNNHDHDDLWRPWYHDDNLNHDDLGDHDDPGDHDTMMTISAHDDHINHDEHLDHEDHLDYDDHLDHDDHHDWRLYTSVSTKWQKIWRITGSTIQCYKISQMNLCTLSSACKISKICFVVLVILFA